MSVYTYLSCMSVYTYLYPSWHATESHLSSPLTLYSSLVVLRTLIFDVLHARTHTLRTLIESNQKVSASDDYSKIVRRTRNF